MLQQLIECKQHSDLIIIEDSAEVRGEKLYLAFLKNHLRKNDGIIHMLHLENSSQYYQEDKNEKVVTYDFFTNPRNWYPPNTNSLFIDENISVNEIVEKNSQKAKEECIFVDSLTKLILYTGFDKSYRELVQFKQHFKRTICLFRLDEIDEREHMKLLQYGVSTYIQMTRYKGRSVLEPSNISCSEWIVHLCMKKPGGKVVTNSESVTIDEYYNVKSKLCEEVKPVVAEEREEEPDMESLTTFKLSLKSSEKEARRKVILPYLRKDQNTSGSVTEQKQPGGKIIYEPDAADDYDDEDPDDDLDV